MTSNDWSLGRELARRMAGFKMTGTVQINKWGCEMAAGEGGKQSDSHYHVIIEDEVCQICCGMEAGPA